MSKWKIIASLLLAAIVIFQIGLTASTAAGQINQVWKVIGKSAVWRGVNFSANQRFANYIEFLNRTIPKDSKVRLLPEQSGPVQMGRTTYMQFYLAPRQVINCTGSMDNCTSDLENTQDYILVSTQNISPDSGFFSDPKRLILFDNSLGVYLPSHATPGNVPIRSFQSIAQLIEALILPVLWLLILTIAGWLVVSCLNPSLALTSQLALGFGLGLGIYSLLLYLALLAGFALSSNLVFALTVLCLGIGFGAFLSIRRTYHLPMVPRLSSKGIPYFLIIFGAVAFCASLLAVGQAYHWSDEVVLWGSKAYGIVTSGLKNGVSEWGTQTTQYPLQIPLMIASFKVLFGDRLPESKLIFPMYYLGLVILIYDFLRQRLGKPISGMLTLIFMATPLIFYQASLAYTNLPLTFYITGAVITLISAYQARDLAAVQGFFLGGVLLALGAWTRPEGLVLSILLTIFAILIFVLGMDKGVRFKALIALIGPLVIYASVWLWTSNQIYQRPVWSGVVFRTGLKNILTGYFNSAGLVYIVERSLLGLIDTRTSGILGFTLVLLMMFLFIVIFLKLSNNSRWAILDMRPSLFIIGSGLLCILAVLGMYLMIANDPGENLSRWLDTGLSRMLIPGITLLFLGLIDWTRQAYATVFPNARTFISLCI